MEVHLIDGTYELFRHYYAQPPAKDGNGIEIGAVRGVIASLFHLVQGGATHIGVATDHVIESFRNRLWPGYKTGEGIEPALLAQFPILEDAITALGVTLWPMVEFEADDALASAAHRYAAASERVVLLSPDKDLAQCVRGRRVVTHDRIRGLTYDEDGVRTKFGVGPESIPDLLALTGDTADGIPGIPGWGRKSAATVLAAYPHIDAIPDDPAAWTVAVRGRDRLAATLAERRADALLYRRLATLRTDVPLAESIDDLRWRGVPRARYQTFAAELGFSGLTGDVRWIDD